MHSIFLLLVAVAAHAVAFQRLPVLPGVFKNRSSFSDDSAAAAALERFHKHAGGAASLLNRRNILRSISAVKERLLNKLPVRKDLIDAMAARLEGTVLDRPSVADINKPIAQYLYGGDVMLSEDDLRSMGDDLPVLTNNRQKRGAPIVNVNRWSKSQPIAFIFNADIDEPTRQTIRTATQKLAANTCLSFKENANVGTQLQFHRGGGCWSYIGQQWSTQQLISIDEGCGIVAIVEHEISHALGIDHTQNRKDRDAFVSVNFGAVNANIQNNFQKRSDAQNNNFGTPYEYGSDMHYGAYDFSNNGQAVLVSSQADYANTMGQRRSLTFNDFKLINTLYSCSATCPQQMICYNGGYTSPKNCNVCVCNEFYSGVNCQSPKVLATLAAGGSFVTTFNNAFNETLNRSGNNYNWDMFGKTVPKIIKAPEGRKIRVTMNRMYPAFNQLPCYAGCPFLGVEFVDNVGGDLTTMGKIFCCTKDETKSFVSQTNVLGYKAYAAPGMPFDATVTFAVV